MSMEELTKFSDWREIFQAAEGSFLVSSSSRDCQLVMPFLSFLIIRCPLFTSTEPKSRSLSEKFSPALEMFIAGTLSHSWSRWARLRSIIDTLISLKMYSWSSSGRFLLTVKWLSNLGIVADWSLKPFGKKERYGASRELSSCSTTRSPSVFARRVSVIVP